MVADNLVREPVRSEKYLMFDIEGKVYGVPIACVKRIMEYAPLNELPLLPKYCIGVISVQDQSIAVLDLLQRFGSGVTKPMQKSCILVMEIPLQNTIKQMGLLVDQVIRVSEINSNQLDEPPVISGQNNIHFLQGITQKEGALLLSIENLFVVDDITVAT